MPLPNPGMDFTPFDTLAAAELDDMVENIEALADGSGLNTGAVTPDKRSSGFKVGTFTAPSATGNLAVTGLGFEPKLVTFFVTFAANDDARSVGNTGAMDEFGNQWSSSWLATATVIRTRTSAATCIRGYSTPGGTFTLQLSAAFVSMDSDGFTVNFTTANNSYVVNWAASA